MHLRVFQAEDSLPVSPSLMAAMTPFATIIATGVDLGSTDTTGQVIYGFNRLLCRLLTAFLKLHLGYGAEPDDLTSDVEVLNLNHKHVVTHFWPDISLERRCDQTRGLLLAALLDATGRTSV